MRAATAYNRPALNARILRPASLLGRFRAVRLGVVALELFNATSQARMLQLIARLFPGKLIDHGLHDGWLYSLHCLIDYCEAANWFEPDHRMLDYLSEWLDNTWGDDDDDNNPDAIREAEYCASLFLSGIPVRRYNWGDEEWLNEVPEMYPLLAAVRALVDQGYESDVIEYQFGKLYPWQVEEAKQALLANPPEPPLDAIPLLVDYVRRETGNPLLDAGADFFDYDYEEWLWDSDLEEIKEWSVLAKVDWARIEALIKWADEQELVEQVLEVITGALGDDNDDDDDTE